jgi:hypothetical protein
MKPPVSPRRAAAARGPLVLMLSTLLLACAACPFTPVESATRSDRLAGAQPFWREVFGGLARRADRGDAESARLALEMFRVAPQVYGEVLDATPAQLRAWRCRALHRDAPCAEAAAA